MQKTLSVTRRNSQIVRQWQLLLLLASSRYETIETLTKAVADAGDRAVTTRTIRRDIDALLMAGFAIVGGGGYFWKLADASTVSMLTKRHVADRAGAR